MPSKVCTQCLVEKPLDQFYKNAKHKDGHTYDCKECHIKAVKDWYNRYPLRRRQIARKQYRRRYKIPAIRRKILDTNIEYAKKNSKKLLEQARVRRFKKNNLPYKPKSFVFYRDVICHWRKESLDVSGPKWKQLLSLPLTPKQRRVVELTIQGISLVGVAKLLNKTQSTITKTWNGNGNHGGIYGKVKKYMPRLLEPYGQSRP